MLFAGTGPEDGDQEEAAEEEGDGEEIGHAGGLVAGFTDEVGAVGDDFGIGVVAAVYIADGEEAQNDGGEEPGGEGAADEGAERGMAEADGGTTERAAQQEGAGGGGQEAGSEGKEVGEAEKRFISHGGDPKRRRE